MSPKRRPVPVVAVVRNEALNGSPLEVTLAGLELIERAAAEGGSNNRISALLRISRDAFRSIRHRQPEVDEALQRGRAANEAELVSLLMDQARKGALVPALFLLKAVHGYREGEPREGAGATVNVQILNLPGTMTPEQYRVSIAGPKDDNDA